jgi:hypothetical protein
VIAEITGDADACPWLATTRRTHGRDPMCLAIALRDARMCQASSEALARQTCGAILRRDGSAGCTMLASRPDQARCARDGERWRSFVLGRGEGEGDAGPAIRTAGHLRLDQPQRATVGSDSAFEVARGVVLMVRRDGNRFELGTLTEDASYLASSLLAGPSFAAEISIPRGKTEARIERAELFLPGRSRLVISPGHAMLAAKLEAFEPERGGKLSLSIDGEIGDASATWHLHADVETFVRDIVTTAALYDLASQQASPGGGVAPPPSLGVVGRVPALFGASGGMR